MKKLGRKVAETVGLRVKGTLGVLLTAYRAGLVSQEEIQNAIERLAQNSVRVSARLVMWFKAQLDNE